MAVGLLVFEFFVTGDLPAIVRPGNSGSLPHGKWKTSGVVFGALRFDGPRRFFFLSPVNQINSRGKLDKMPSRCTIVVIQRFTFEQSEFTCVF